MSCNSFCSCSKTSVYKNRTVLMLFGQIAALADLHRHAQRGQGSPSPGTTTARSCRRFFLFQHAAPSPTHSPSGLPFCPHLAADALALLLGLLLTAIYCRCVTSSCICQNLLCEDISTK